MTTADGGWLACDRTAAALEKLEPVLRASIDTQELQLKVMALELVTRGGKRLRPALLFLCASVCRNDAGYEHARGAREPTLLRAAAALEMVHVASLYHDDVMDRAPLRRRGASANARWGNTLASLAGTYLFARASVLLATLPQAANRLASDAFVELCSGQLQETENAYNVELSEAEHLDILARKTGALFALPCKLGAQLGAADPATADSLARYGQSLGVAFQLADDALDVIGQADTMGKAAGTDLREGVYGLAVLRTLGHERHGERTHEILAKAALTAQDVQDVLALVRDCGAIDHALATAREHAARALAAIKMLPQSAARISLERLAHHAVARSS